MNYIIKKYSLSILLAFLMLVVVSCHKGGEPIPYSNESSITDSNGLVNNSSRETSVNDIGATSTEGEGSDAPEGGSSDGDGSSGSDDNTVIGGDDNEDDDDGGKVGDDDDDDDDDDDNGGNVSNTGGGR